MSKLQWITDKILSASDAVRWAKRLRVNNKSLVFTNGCFDILHHGHIRYLAEAADEGNALIVAVNTDASVKKLKGEGRPVQQEQDRALQIAALLCVDAVVLFDEETPLQLIELLQPDVLVKGGDYTIERIVGAPEVQARGGRVAIIPFVEGYSTTGLIERITRL